MVKKRLTGRITVRLDSEIEEQLLDAASTHGMETAVFARNLIRSGLSNFNATSDKLLDYAEKLDATTEIIQSLTSGALFLFVRDIVQNEPQREDETDDAFNDRKQQIFISTVQKAFAGGSALIKRIQTDTV